MTDNFEPLVDFRLPSGHAPTTDELLFARAYLESGGNASEAARVSKAVVVANANRFAKRPVVRELIGYLARESFEIGDVNIERVLRELHALAFVKNSDLFYQDGTPIPLHMLPPSVAATVKEYDFQITHSKDENGEDVITRRAKVKLHDKVAALDKLARYLRMYDPEAGEVGVPVEFIVEREA